MTYDQLKAIVESGIALTYAGQHQPAGGTGTKVLPTLFAERRYAFESRLIDGATRSCVLLDTVPSQANRMEACIDSARSAMAFGLPGVAVRFPTNDPDLRHLDTITDLNAPHRIADAIIRDSVYEGTRFLDSEYGATLRTASISNATGMFGLSPTSLVFGYWYSFSPIKGRDYRFERSISGEIVGIDAVAGVKTRSRIDPLNLRRMKAYSATGTLLDWTTEPKAPDGTKLNPLKNLSAIGHGNIAPAVLDKAGGVTIAYADHRILVSPPVLRRLRFPDDGGHEDTERNTAARTVLAALALVGASGMLTGGLDLRTRTLLIPEQIDTWTAILSDGHQEEVTITHTDMIAILDQAVERALELDLPWSDRPVELTPSDGLIGAIRRSMEAEPELMEDEE